MNTHNNADMDNNARTIDNARNVRNVRNVHTNNARTTHSNARTVDQTVSLRDVITANIHDDIILSDRGNGRRLVEMYRHILRYVVDRDEWIVRDGPHWRKDIGRILTFALTGGVIRSIREEALSANEIDVEQSILEYARRMESEQARWRMINSAREYPEITIIEDELDHDGDIIATPSEVIDLRTGETHEPVADDLCTTHTCVEYDPDATSPELDRYLETFIPDPVDQNVLFAILGTALRAGNHARLLPIFLGGTTCGKSQLLAALSHLLGDYICSINPSVFRGNLDDKPRPDLVRAMYKRIAYAMEASRSWELHSDQVKRITGGDSIPYRNLFDSSTERVPRFTPIIVTNEMPHIRGADAALRRRILVFPFTRTLASGQEDTRIKDKFINDEKCLQALLARIVAGARSPLLISGVRWDLMPKRFAHYTMDAFGELDHIDTFLEWIKERGTMVIIPMSTPVSRCARTSDLHSWYVYWVKKHGNSRDKAEQLSLREFGQLLRDRGWKSKISAGTRWLGIQLNDICSVFTVS